MKHLGILLLILIGFQQTLSAQVGIGTTTPDVGTMLDVRGTVQIKDGTEGADKVLVSDTNGKASWEDVNGGVKIRVIHQVDGGANTEVVLWSHPEGIEVRFDADSETVTVENKTGDTDYWDVVINGGAISGNSVKTTSHKYKFIADDGSANETLFFDLGNLTGGWFTIIAADQNDEKDGFIMNIVYYSDDLNGTVQYWDEE